MNRAATVLSSLVTASLIASGAALPAQEKPAEGAASPLQGSIIEDRAARKLLEAGDARYDSDEVPKAVEIWQSVIERYPRSKVRFEAHMKLGRTFLEREREYDKARVHFEAVAAEENRDEDQRAEASLQMGVCFYEARNFGKSFQIMREVIEKFPTSSHINQAWYYIGLGHFQLGHYSRAIDALEKVGTSLGADDSRVEKVEAGKRLFVKIEDADLATLEPGTSIKLQCEATSGDVETVECFPIGRNVRIVLGSVATKLGKPVKGNGQLELKGDDKVSVVYVDEQTADRQFNRKLIREISVVGDALVSVMDGAFAETLQGVVLGKTINVQTNDPDRDLTDAADQLQAVAELYRQKSDEEIEKETLAALSKTDGDKPELDEDGQPKIDRFRKIDEVPLTLVEVKLAQQETEVPGGADPMADVLNNAASASTAKTSATKTAGANEAGSAKSAAAKLDAAAKAAGATTPANDAAAKPETATSAPQPIDDGSIHSGVFRASIALVRADEVVAGNPILEALPGDAIRIVYRDATNTTDGEVVVRTEARCIEGNLGGVRVTRTQISDRELQVRTKLKTAHALTNIANRYKEFGLKKNADGRYAQALELCEEIMEEARKLGGRLLEETYVQLWTIYFEMDRLELAAAMAERLQRDFPNSGFVDDALLQLADVARKQGNLNRAIGIYTRLVNMQTSQLRGEAQFGIAECYRQQAEAAMDAAQSSQLMDRAFQEYKKVFDQFPDSGRVGEAVSQMADYYYKQKDYTRAVDTFETVLANHPDAKFLDVILFNYGRCLYRMERRKEARQRFDQLIGDYPESALAPDARKISEALAQGGF